MKSKIYLIGALLIFAIGCDTIEGDYFEDPDNLQSTVTLFEFTGIECVNCPEKGHEVVANYQEKFGDKLQVVSIHGNDFAGPIDGFFLRTAEGQELAKLVKVGILPEGTVNSLVPGTTKVPSALSADITVHGYKTPDLDIDVDFEVTESKIIVTVNGTFRSQLSQSYNNLNIGVYLVQSEIEGPQKDNRLAEGIVENYIHTHALRKPFTAIDGDFYVKTPQGGMVVDKKQFEININDANLKFAEGQTINDLHLEPIVFVLDADSKKLIPCLINYN